jgi:hypothetical protein
MWLVAWFVALMPWVLEGWLLVKEESAPTDAIVARGNEVLRRGEPAEGASAAEALGRAEQAVVRVRDEVEKSVLPNGREFYLSFYELLNEDSERPAAVMEAARRESLRALDMFRREGVFDLVLEAGRAPRQVVWPIRDHRVDREIGIRLNPLLLIAKANAVRQRLSAEAGEWDEYAHAVENSLVLARVVGRSGTLIHRKVALHAYERPLERLWEDLGSGRVPMSVLDRLAVVLDRVKLSPTSERVELWRVEMELLCAMYFSAGPLGGRPLLSQVDEGQTLVTVIEEAIGHEVGFVDRLPKRGVWNLMALPLASRRETERELLRSYEDLNRASIMDRPGRKARAWVRMPGTLRHAYTREMEDLCFGATDTWLSEEERAAFKADGTRLLLALERHRVRHEGRAPEQLEALVPEFIGSVPRDPVSGKPLVYRVIDPQADALGRAYVLYSVGSDGVDNGGEYDPMRNQGSLMGPATAAGHDFVFSVPPRYVRKHVRVQLGKPPVEVPAAEDAGESE